MFSSHNLNSSAKHNTIDLNGSHLSNLGTPLDQSTPAFLYGKRKGAVPATYSNIPLNTTSAPCADIFAAPVQANVSQGSKSVHWAPAVVQNEKPATPVQNNQNLSFGVTSSASASHSFGGQALNAPPLRSLRDKVEPAKKIARRNTFAARSTPTSTPITQRIPSRVAEDQNATETSTDVADTWVTVFGFTPNQTAILLNLFSRHGEVVSHQAPSRGNFMHIRYSCVTHAQQALSRNGTLLDHDTLIGVVPCTNKEVIGGSAAGIVARSSTMNTTINRSASVYNSFVDSDIADQSVNENSVLNSSNVFDANNSLNSSRISVRSGVGMRPLAADQRNNTLQGTPSSRKPQQDGLLNKLWNTMGLN